MVGSQPAACFEGQPLCQHGDAECEGNRYEACAAIALSCKHDPEGDPRVCRLSGSPRVTALQSAEFAYCLEDGGLNVDFEVIEACATSVGINYGTLANCAAQRNALGDGATRDAANQTAQYSFVYGESWPGTPTVVLDGKTLFTTADLLGQVCAAAGAAAEKVPGCN